MDSEKKSYEKILSILTEKKLPSHDEIFEITEKVSDILETEITAYRPAADDKSPGGLIDLSESPLPLIVVPDLHARPDFLLNILNYKINGDASVWNELENKKINIVFVGDILHTERNTRQRWLDIQEEFNQENYTGPLITAEMKEGLSLLWALLMLKTLFPDNCHILKGNHENILNVTGDGDFSFKKYSDEGQMCKIFIQEYYGDDVLYMISCVEKVLPLVFLSGNCVVSHAEPVRGFTLEEIINCRLCKGVVEGLTWTANDAAEEGSVDSIIKALAGITECDSFVYLGGHRPVSGKYSLRQNGRYIQIHNPSHQRIAIVDCGRKFNPETDIVEVGR